MTNSKYPDITALMQLCSKMAAERIEYDQTIKESQIFLEASIEQLRAIDSEYSHCYADIIREHMDNWWNWRNDQKQMKLF